MAKTSSQTDANTQTKGTPPVWDKQIGHVEGAAWPDKKDPDILSFRICKSFFSKEEGKTIYYSKYSEDELEDLLEVTQRAIAYRDKQRTAELQDTEDRPS